MPYFETSVKKGINVDEAFDELVRNVMAQEKEKKVNFDPHQLNPLDFGRIEKCPSDTLVSYPSRYCGAC